MPRTVRESAVAYAVEADDTEGKEYELLTEPFVIIEDCVWENRDLQDALPLYCALKSHRNHKTGRCFPSIRTLAVELQRSTKTIQKWKELLVHEGVLRYTAGNQEQSNAYVFPRLTIKGTTWQKVPHPVVESTTPCGTTVPHNHMNKPYESNHVEELCSSEKERRTTDTTVGEDTPPDSPKTNTQKRGGTAHKQMVAVLLNVCHVDNTLGSYAAKVAKQLLDGDYAPEQIEKWYSAEGWWYKVHTKGWSTEFKKPPSLSKVAQTVLQAKEYLGRNDGRMGVANADGSFNI